MVLCYNDVDLRRVHVARLCRQTLQLKRQADGSGVAGGVVVWTNDVLDRQADPFTLLGAIPLALDP